MNMQVWTPAGSSPWSTDRHIDGERWQDRGEGQPRARWAEILSPIYWVYGELQSSARVGREGLQYGVRRRREVWLSLVSVIVGSLTSQYHPWFHHDSFASLSLLWEGAEECSHPGSHNAEEGKVVG